MPRVRALVKCFVDNGIREVGDEFEYKGPDNPCLEFLDGEPAAEPMDEPAPAKPKAKRATVADKGAA